jgi:uncharacterized delta-60 repeat protein
MSRTGTPRGARTRAALTLAIAASALTPAVASAAAAGDLDPSFGTGGKRVLAGVERPLDLYVQADGKIIEVAGQNASITGFLVRRLNPDGSPDKSFDGNGAAVAKFPNLSGSIDAVGSVLQPDGSIVVAGNHSQAGVVAARFRPDGSLDPTFGEGGPDGDGRAAINVPYFGVNDVVAQPNGKIALVGSAGNDSDYAVVRLRFDGSVDATTWDYADFNDANDHAVTASATPDGAVTILGYTDGPSNTNLGAVARYKTDGKLDSSFGGGTGLVKVPSIEWPTATLVQPDGKVLVAGYKGQDQYTGVVTRLTTSGEVDKTFGNQGITEIASPDRSDAPSAIAFQPDGKIVVGGSTAATAENAIFEVWVTRLDADGHLDPSYGIGGRATYVPGEVSLGGPIAVQPDGKVVSAAYTVNGLLPRPALTRLLPDPAPDTPGPAGGGQGPTTDGPGGGGAQNPPRDTIAPKLSRLRVVTTRRGRELRFAASEAASVRFAVQSAPRRGRAKTARGSFSIVAVPGPNRIDVTRRSLVRRLPAGRYRLIAVPTDASGNKGAAVRALFRVAPKKK